MPISDISRDGQEKPCSHRLTVPWGTSSHKMARERGHLHLTPPLFQHGAELQGTARLSSNTSSSRAGPWAHTATRPFWCHTHSVTDAGKSGWGDKSSGFDGLSERHFKGEENVQIIKRPLSLMHFKMAIIHLMPKRRKEEKNQRTIRKMLWLIIVLSSL